MKKEVTMYKLAIVGIVLSGVLMSAAIAQAKPVGMSKAEDRALVIRSEGLNQKYGVGQKSQQAIIREKLGEIGAWAVTSTSTTSTQQPIIREKLGEIGAWAVPSTSTTSTPTPVVSSDDGFDWNNAGIGAAFVLGAMLLGVASLATRRRHHRPVAH
jgi:type II secretory pathway pseudopilin PulG